jgi:L-malate glycosyltransferase
MKRIMVLDTDYPAPDFLYGDVFVHTRVKEYAKSADVRLISFFRDRNNYEYDGILVRHAPTIDQLKEEYDRYRPDILFIHFYNKGLFEFVTAVDVPVVVWVHGYEAMGWYRRWFNYELISLIPNLFHIVADSLNRMLSLRKLIHYANRTKRVHFVFVSNWLKKVVETDTFRTRIKNYSIIHNPINCSLFRYEGKHPELRKNILLIRSFEAKVYANDVAMEAIRILSLRPCFKDLQFSIFGQGRYFDVLTDRIKEFQNVFIHKTYLPNSEIPAIHDRHGIFLSPARLDTQGVSRCEAMASGLVPLTTNCTAIPEFVENEVSGFLTRSAGDLAEAMERLYNDPALFSRISHSAAQAIREKCDIGKIVKAELGLIQR